MSRRCTPVTRGGANAISARPGAPRILRGEHTTRPARCAQSDGLLRDEEAVAQARRKRVAWRPRDTLRRSRPGAQSLRCPRLLARNGRALRPTTYRRSAQAFSQGTSSTASCLFLSATCPGTRAHRDRSSAPRFCDSALSTRTSPLLARTGAAIAQAAPRCVIVRVLRARRPRRAFAARSGPWCSSRQPRASPRLRHRHAGHAGDETRRARKLRSNRVITSTLSPPT
jgi:hypothetical protein